MTNVTTTPQQTIEDILGLAHIPPGERDFMLAGIGELILESVMVRAVSGMTDEQATVFTKEIAACTDALSIRDALEKHVPDFDVLMEEESQAFREECVEMLSRLAFNSNMA